MNRAFNTDRLRLRQWRESDLEPFAALNAGPRVMEYFPAPLSRAESDALARHCAGEIAERGWGLWAVETLDAAAHWGRGYATEAAREVLRVGFEVLELQEIVSFTAVRNQRSRAVMERIGMQPAGRFEHPAVPAESGLREHWLYRLDRERGRT